MFCLEITGSFDEYLSVANEKGWERKLPLIRSLSDIFSYRVPPCLIFTETRNQRCSQGRRGAAECLKTCFGYFSVCLRTYSILALLQVGASRSLATLASSVPCCPRTAQQMQSSWCFSPRLQSSICSCVSCPHSAWPGMNPCLDLLHPLVGRLPSNFQLKTQFVRKGSELLFGLPLGPLASRLGRSSF